MSKAILWVVGTPIDDSTLPEPRTLQCLERANVYIGESRKLAGRILSRVPGAKEKPLFLLDESARPEEKEWKPALREIARTGGEVAVFSDSGMPLLFDPGNTVLEFCLQNDFTIRSRCSPTSWGSACALSGWTAPFSIVGFPPREDAERRRFWGPLLQSPSHTVVMERPYRFLALLSECAEHFGKSRPAFLAWEIDSENENLIWGSLDEIQRRAKAFEKTKGEFVLVIQGARPSLPRKNSF